jgi:hypothetical protein
MVQAFELLAVGALSRQRPEAVCSSLGRGEGYEETVPPRTAPGIHDVSLAGEGTPVPGTWSGTVDLQESR